MAPQVLGKLLDPVGLDRASGPRGRLRIEVPAGWLARRSEVEIRLPNKVTCARCEGGGCDGCGRSGALAVTAADPPARVRLVLPDRPAGATIRLVHPVAGCDLEQLLVEVRVGQGPSAHVAQVRERGSIAPGAAVVGWLLAVALLALLAAFAALLAGAW